MRAPDLCVGEFLLLGAVVGGPRRPCDIAAFLEWETCKENLRMIAGRLVRMRYLERLDGVRAGKRVSERLYGITERGRRAYQEAADFFLYAIERFAKPQPAGAGYASLQVVAESGDDPMWRSPTGDEEAAILAAASPAFRLVYRGLGLLGPCIEDVVGLGVEDVDFERGLVRCGGVVRKLAGELLELLAEAVGERRTGPVFLAPEGGAWRSRNLQRTFSRYRDAAGVSRAAKLRGERRYRGNGSRTGKRNGERRGWQKRRGRGEFDAGADVGRRAGSRRKRTG